MDARERQTSNLLALRDGEPADASAEQELRNDPDQQVLLERLHALKAEINGLQPLAPDPAVWEAIRTRAEVRADRGSSAPVGSSRRISAVHAPLAMVAGLVGAVAVTLLMLAPDPELNSPPDELAAYYGAPQDLEVLYRRSRELEPLSRLVGANTAGPTERALLFGIADVDARLAAAPDGQQPQELRRLWDQRVTLLESLAESRRTRAALHPAVY